MVTRSIARPAARRRRLPRAARQESLLRAAAAVFARTGFAGTSMDEVAAAAGVTRLIVYRHFGAKVGLYRSILDGVLAQVAAALRAETEPGAFGVGARALLRVARADPDGFRLLWRQAAREPRFAPAADRLRARAVTTARTALAGRVPAANLTWAAHALIGYLVEAVLGWLEFGDPRRDADFVRATNAALRAGVRAWGRNRS